MAWIQENGYLTENSGDPIKLLVDLLLDGDLKFTQTVGSIDLRSSKDQGYKFGIWDSVETKYSLFVDTNNHVGIGTNAPYALLTVIQDATNNTEYAAGIVNTSELGSGLSVIAGDAVKANTVFTSRSGEDVVKIFGSGDIYSKGKLHFDSDTTEDDMFKLLLSTNNVSRHTMSQVDEETGDDVGSNLLYSVYNDLGAFIKDVLFIERKTGNITVGSRARSEYTLQVDGDTNINGSLYVNGSLVDLLAPQIGSLDSIQDVTLSNLQIGDTIIWSGTNWINATSSSSSGGGFTYRGLWNADANVPDIHTIGSDGDLYVVVEPGTTEVDGVNSWGKGDMVYRQNGVWYKLPTASEGSVTSVAGQTGDIILTTDNVNEGNLLYFTESRARGAISSASPELTYNQNTGEFTFNSDYKSLTNAEYVNLSKKVVNSTFDIATGLLEFINNTSDVEYSINLDGRYSLENHIHNYDYYNKWDLKVGNIVKTMTSDSLLTLSPDSTMTASINPVTGIVTLGGSAITGVKLEDNNLVFTSVGASFGESVDLSSLLDYTPSRVSPTTKEVGGISIGTDYATLSGMSISGIIDKMLYGDDAGTTFDIPEITIIFEKDGNAVTSVAPGTTLDSTFEFNVNTMLGSYSNDVGTVQGTYLSPISSYTYNLYLNGIVIDTKSVVPSGTLSFDLTGVIINTDSTLKLELIVPARDVVVTLSDNSSVTLRLPAQNILEEITIEAKYLHYYLKVADEASIPSTGAAFKAVATSVAQLDTVVKDLTSLVYMLAVPTNTELKVIDLGSVSVDYISNNYFVKSTTLTSIPNEANVDVLYDVYVLSNSVPYSNTNNFNITIL